MKIKTLKLRNVKKIAQVYTGRKYFISEEINAKLRGAAAGLREPPPYFLRLLPPRLGEGPARPQPCASCRSEELKNISDKSLLLIKLFQEFCEGTK
ncbi:G patch domain-containing protein 8 [Manis javanica]|nr:G patch domain-containing protein 8 [Manis javanica]